MHARTDYHIPTYIFLSSWLVGLTGVRSVALSAGAKQHPRPPTFPLHQGSETPSPSPVLALAALKKRPLRAGAPSSPGRCKSRRKRATARANDHLRRFINRRNWPSRSNLIRVSDNCFHYHITDSLTKCQIAKMGNTKIRYGRLNYADQLHCAMCPLCALLFLKIGSNHKSLNWRKKNWTKAKKLTSLVLACTQQIAMCT